MSPPTIWVKLIRERQKQLAELERIPFWQIAKRKKRQKLIRELDSYQRTLSYYPFEDQEKAWQMVEGWK